MKELVLIYKQNDLDRMLSEVISDALKAKIPVDETIERKVYIDAGVTNRVGFCNWCFRKYEIHITDKLVFASEKYIKDVLAHEILHTCFLCKTHDYPWNHYAKIMNDKYGYNIKQLYHSWKEIGVEV